jgi:creatinine amidohydrolase
MSVLQLADLRWTEAAEFQGGSDAVAILPLGAVEQHGPHLPLETDTLISRALACAVAERVPFPAVVGPAIAGGLSSHHLGFPGTVTLPEEAFGASILAFVDGFARMGIERTAVFSAHGGNFGFLAKLAANDERVLAFSDLDRYLGRMFDVGRSLSIEVPETDVHAGALETSLALFLFPEKVADSYREVAGCVDAFDGWREHLFEHGVRSLTDTGVMGDPSLAREELGEAVFEGLADLLAEWLTSEVGISARLR